MSIAYLNGVYAPLEETRVSVLDRGFLFGDGVYEVIPVYGRKGFLQDQHLARLENSLAATRIRNPHTRTEWENLLHELIRRNEGDNQAIYLQVTRGSAPRLHTFPEGISPTVLITSQPLTIPVEAKPAKVITRPDIRWDRCDIKSIALIGNVLLRQEAVDSGCLETILIRNGQVTEGAASNVFVVREGHIMTPPNTPLLLGGITRDFVIDLCRMENLPIDAINIPEATLHGADEIWITGSLMGIAPVIELDGLPVGLGEPGPFWERIYALFRKYYQDSGEHVSASRRD
uniref:Aminodeoxychorismate lyase n=1 Tax=Candidatus Kentrum sp. TUN TaxID=2126343 RepID=A0A450ZXD4_9GAMM|nr:MAG: D-alanine transaminase [Candidatus Kentron sp. TUN]VFK60313.1 MAG: D-alanine transaminase [Candidatus Kentron sp. TUN]VFK67335.1 MAG: D-alanine transaminase [Candidatus Kentron sp. TUN]